MSEHGLMPVQMPDGSVHQMPDTWTKEQIQGVVQTYMNSVADTPMIGPAPIYDTSFNPPAPAPPGPRQDSFPRQRADPNLQSLGSMARQFRPGGADASGIGDGGGGVSGISPDLKQGKISERSFKARIQRSGVSMDGASAKARRIANLGSMKDTNAIPMAKQALEIDLGRPVEMKRMGVEGKNERGEVGPIVWREEGQKQWRLWNVPGPGSLGGAWADANAAGPHVAQLGAEVVGGGIAAIGGAAAGTAAGGPVTGALAAYAAGVAGDAGATLAADWFRMKRGQLAGLNMTDEEISEEAWHSSQLALLGAAGLPIAAKLLKMMGARKIPSFIAKQLPQKKLDEIVAEADALSLQLARTTGQPLREGEAGVTVGQSIQPPHGGTEGLSNADAELKDFLLTIEKELGQGMEAGKPLRDVKRGQMQYAGDQVDRMTAAPDGRAAIQGQAAVQEIGAQVKDTISGPVEQAEKVLDTAFKETEDRAAREAAGVAQDTTAREGVESLRGALLEERDRVFAELKQGYIAKEPELDAVTGGYEQAYKVAEEEMETLSRYVAQSTRGADRGIIKDFVNRTRKPTYADDGKTITGYDYTEYSLLDMQRELSDLKDEVTRLNMGTGTAKETRVLSRLVKALEEDKARILTDKPKLQAELSRLDQEWHKNKETFDRSLVGALLKMKRGYSKSSPTYQWNDKQVITAILEGGNSGQIISALKRPLQQDTGEALAQDIRSGIMDVFNERFVNKAKGRVTNVAAAEVWLRRNDKGLRNFLSPEQYKTVTNAQKFGMMTVRNKAAFADLTRDMNRLLGTEMKNWDSNVVMNKLWQENKSETLAKTMSILKRRDPSLARAFEEASRIHVLKKEGVIQWDPLMKNWNLDAAKLQNLVSDKGKGGMLAPLITVFGKEYVDNLRTFSRYLNTINPEPMFKMGNSERVSGLGAVLYGPKQALRVIFPPLSGEGRALTAGMQTKSRIVQKRVSEALADPRKLRMMLRLRRMTKWDVTATTLAGMLGMEILYQPSPAVSGVLQQMKDLQNGVTQQPQPGVNR